MYLTGLGTALPENRFTQAECWAAIQKSPQFPGLTPRSHAVLRKVLTGENGISARHLAVTELSEAFSLTPAALHPRFAEHAPRLATAAAERALAAAGLAPKDVDALSISTCTGYLCPGLTSYVAERLGLRSDVHALDLVGQGCGAAMPNCRTAESMLSSGRARHVLCVCVEVTIHQSARVPGRGVPPRGYTQYRQHRSPPSFPPYRNESLQDIPYETQF